MYLMFVPTRRCTTACTYCYFDGDPADGTDLASPAVVERVIELMAASRRGGDLRVHTLNLQGGEPLLAGCDVLGRLFEATAGLGIPIGMQSNLHPLDDALVALLTRHDVGVGTSLDGPREITDAQRGEGCYDRTRAGMERLSRAGKRPGVICTFTGTSADRWEQVFTHFEDRGQSFSLHAAVETAGPGESVSLGPEAWGELLTAAYTRWRARGRRPSIHLFDTVERQLAARSDLLCTYQRCLGKYLAVDPEGWLYPCNRFLGQPAFCMGNVLELDSFDGIQDSSPWRWLDRWYDARAKDCASCDFTGYCKGGCPYQGVTANLREGHPAGAAGNLPSELPKDPYCAAYLRLFSVALDAVAEDVLRDSPDTFERAPGGR